MNTAHQKRLAGVAAAALVENGMCIGLGTGSTAYHVLQRLSERIQSEGLSITGVPSSIETAKLANQFGIPLLPDDAFTQLDLAIDGADECDPDGNLLKGGGGALFREKLLIDRADQVIICIDSSKQVSKLGATPLPVEVIPFGWESTATCIAALGAIVRLRRVSQPDAPEKEDAPPLITDNHGMILDCQFGEIDDLASLEQALQQIVGVTETGLFINMASQICIGSDTGVSWKTC